MLSRLPKRGRRLLRWLVPGAIVALAPKCVLCLAAYLGLGTVLGWRGVELCGAPDSAGTHRIVWLVAAGVALGVSTVVIRACGICRKRASAPSHRALRGNRPHAPEHAHL